MKGPFRRVAALAITLLVAALAPAFGDEPARMLGRIVGERCAAEGRLGECYLAWAHPMVFLDASGEVWRIDLAASGIRQERLDEAFGQEVELFGQPIRDGGQTQLRIARLNILAPPRGREFFKG